MERKESYWLEILVYEWILLNAQANNQYSKDIKETAIIMPYELWSPYAWCFLVRHYYPWNANARCGESCPCIRIHSKFSSCRTHLGGALWEWMKLLQERVFHGKALIILDVEAFPWAPPCNHFKKEFHNPEDLSLVETYVGGGYSRHKRLLLCATTNILHSYSLTRSKIMKSF